MKQLLGLLCCCWVFLWKPANGQSSAPPQALLVIGYEPFEFDPTKRFSIASDVFTGMLHRWRQKSRKN